MIINVITRHTPSNYGSLLQSIATIKILERLGHKAEIIDYKRDDERGYKKVWTEARLKSENLLKQLIYTTIRYPIEYFAESRFDKMRTKYLPMTKRCSTHEQLGKIKADIFMTGSDQVWGPMVNGHYDSAYFLKFVKKGKKVSYAASFGKTKFDDATITDYKEMLSTYDKIAVREDSAVKLLDSWGLKNCNGLVLDPTILLVEDEWAKLMISLNLQKKYEKQKYILVYQIHNDPQLSEYALRLAEYTGLHLLRVNPFIHQVLRGGKFIWCPDVSEFLALIKNATYIVTDSFHGTCFALNFNKQFIEILPNNSTGTRNQSILSLTGLSNRIVSDFNNFTIVDRKIDYNPVNMIIDGERKRSIEVMNMLLK